MESVLGIGGFFFRAKDPAALAQWYATNLGVSRTPTSHDGKPWTQQAGATAFQPFPMDTGYFANPAKTWMLNFRVADIDAMVAQLQGAGIKVELDKTTYPIGRFARLTDPEGNPIELWQPAA